MTRVSLTESYDNKDVISQIVRLKDAVGNIENGVLSDIELTEDTGTYTMTFTFTDGSEQSFSWDVNTVDIQDITMTYADGVYTLVFTFTDGTSKSFVLVLGDLVTTDQMNDALALKQDVLTFDNDPTEDSTNPVKSGGVYDALALKQDVLTFDGTPTEDSTNPVTSGGIYDALGLKQDALTIAPGDAKKVLTVNSSETGTEWTDVYKPQKISLDGIDFSDYADEKYTSSRMILYKWGTSTVQLYNATIDFRAWNSNANSMYFTANGRVNINGTNYILENIVINVSTGNVDIRYWSSLNAVSTTTINTANITYTDGSFYLQEIRT